MSWIAQAEKEKVFDLAETTNNTTPGATSSVLVTSSDLLLVVRPGAPFVAMLFLKAKEMRASIRSPILSSHLVSVSKDSTEN